jgi:hypothetical protein
VDDDVFLFEVHGRASTSEVCKRSESMIMNEGDSRSLKTVQVLPPTGLRYVSPLKAFPENKYSEILVQQFLISWPSVANIGKAVYFNNIVSNGDQWLP